MYDTYLYDLFTPTFEILKWLWFLGWLILALCISLPIILWITLLRKKAKKLWTMQVKEYTLIWILFFICWVVLYITLAGVVIISAYSGAKTLVWEIFFMVFFAWEWLGAIWLFIIWTVFGYKVIVNSMQEKVEVKSMLLRWLLIWSIGLFICLYSFYIWECRRKYAEWYGYRGAPRSTPDTICFIGLIYSNSQYEEYREHEQARMEQETKEKIEAVTKSLKEFEETELFKHMQKLPEWTTTVK